MRVVRVEDAVRETDVSVSEIRQWVKFDDDPVSPTFTFTPHRSWHAGEFKVTVGEDAGML